jgi:hypothetical protein
MNNDIIWQFIYILYDNRYNTLYIVYYEKETNILRQTAK